MKGILLISHGRMAEGMMDTISLFFGNLEQTDYICLKKEDNPSDFKDAMEKKIQALDTGDGVLVLADMLGGTPCNQSAYFIQNSATVITGLNLPMLLTVMAARENIDFDQVMNEGRTGICCLNDIVGVERK